MKKGVKIALIALILLIVLGPIPVRVRDGGSIYFKPLTGVYQVRVYRACDTDENGTEGWKKGIEIDLLGKTVYGNTYFTTEK